MDAMYPANRLVVFFLLRSTKNMSSAIPYSYCCWILVVLRPNNRRNCTEWKTNRPITIFYVYTQYLTLHKVWRWCVCVCVVLCIVFNILFCSISLIIIHLVFFNCHVCVHNFALAFCFARQSHILCARSVVVLFLLASRSLFA